MISNELSKPYTTRTKKTIENYEQGYEEIFAKKKWYNVYNFSIINKMIKKVLGKFVLYSKDGKKVLGKFGSEKSAKEREREVVYFRDKKAKK